MKKIIMLITMLLVVFAYSVQAYAEITLSDDISVSRDEFRCVFAEGSGVENEAFLEIYGNNGVKYVSLSEAKDYTSSGYSPWVRYKGSSLVINTTQLNNSGKLFGEDFNYATVEQIDRHSGKAGYYTVWNNSCDLRISGRNEKLCYAAIVPGIDDFPGPLISVEDFARIYGYEVSFMASKDTYYFVRKGNGLIIEGSTTDSIVGSLEDMYEQYKAIINYNKNNIDEISCEAFGEPYPGLGISYTLYDIDKDNVAELFLFAPMEVYGLLHVYTYKNGKVIECGNMWSNKLCANEYGNGVAIGGGTGAGDKYDFYVLEGNKLLKTGQKYECDWATFFEPNKVYADDLGLGPWVHAINGKIVSDETHKKYFYELEQYTDLDYLDRYFHKK